MILNDAFRYQNFLTGIINDTLTYLRDNNNTMAITETHKKSLARPEEKDEIIDKRKDRAIKMSADQVVSFLMLAFQEKHSLTLAISKTKADFCPNIDGEMADNRVRQRITDTLRRMSMLKCCESKSRGNAYCFNSDGNQVQYYYDVEVKNTVDFNKANLKKLVSNLYNESNEVSNQISKDMSTIDVDFTPRFDINSTFEELVEQFFETKVAS